MRYFKLLLITAVLFAFCTVSYAEDARRTATVVRMEGGVEIQQMGTGQWIPAKEAMLLNEGDIIRTDSKGFALLKLNGAVETATVEVEKNSQLVLAELMENKTAGTQQTLLDLAIGKILIRAQKLHSEDSKFEVKTPTSVVGVRGTTFSVEVEALE